MALQTEISEDVVDGLRDTKINEEEEEGPSRQEIESLCMRCGENGTTRLLLTKIPHFRELVVMAFDCPHCNERNSEVQFVGQLQPRGCTYQLTVAEGDSLALNRQVVKSDSATITVPELEFEVPPESQRGSLTTVEGVFTRAAEELRALQDERKKVDAETASRIEEFVEKLDACSTGKMAFTFVLDDPAGNSFVENPNAPKVDPLMVLTHYERTGSQSTAMGFLSEEIAAADGLPELPKEPSKTPADNVPAVGLPAGTKYAPAGTSRPHGSVGAEIAHNVIARIDPASESLFKYEAPEEVMVFPATCGACGGHTETRMFVTSIPYFKEVIVMSSACDLCGFRSSELKPGGAIPAKGKHITVKILNQRDLSRDLIKSETAAVKIPEVELELAAGTLGGCVTTVEGLVTNIKESLGRVHGFSMGDSAQESQKKAWVEFDQKLDKLLLVEEPWTLVLDDALANSFIAPATDDLEADKQLSSYEYERSMEQDEELGLLDIDTSAGEVPVGEVSANK